MSELDRRAARGIRVLLGRQAGLQILTFGAGIVLARTLTPSQFGLYFIASFFVSTFAFFGDFGLAPSLIQQRDSLVARDLRVAFTLQLVATTAVVLVLLGGAHWFVLLYPHVSSSTVWLIRVLALQLYLAVFRSVSVLQLERSLSYGRVAAIEVVEAVAFQAVALGFALAGFGVWSFAFAVLIRGVLGCVLAFGFAPWRIGFAFDRETARRLLRFGVPFQVTAIVQQAGGWVTPVLVGTLLGPSAVGLLTWASSNARKPLLAVESVMRVSFPHMSRVQEDPEEVERVLSRYLRPLLLLAGLWFTCVAVAAPGLVPFVYGRHWTPAVPALVVFAGALYFDTFAWTLGTSLFGVGRAGTVARANLARTIVFVAVGVALVELVGIVGVAIAALLSIVAASGMLIRNVGTARGRVTRSLLVALGPTTAGLTAGLAVHALPVADPLRSAIAGVAAGAAFVAVCLTARLFRVPALEPRPAA